MRDQVPAGCDIIGAMISRVGEHNSNGAALAADGVAGMRAKR